MIKNAIELYLMYKESSNIDWGTCRKEHLLGGKVQSSFSLTPHEESAKNDVEKICKEGALNLQIYNLGERSGKLKARARGVRNPALIVYHPDSKQLKKRDITDNIAYDELLDFIYGNDLQSRPSKADIETPRYDGKTIIEVPAFACVECGSHQFKIYHDHSGSCAKCGKSYLEIK